jgi:dTDP-4-dehydrorhamnose 3,5-epimerase
MQIIDTVFDDVKQIIPTRIGDDRGYFCETFNQQRMAAAGLDFDWVQDNESRSQTAGTIRGLHYQAAPFAQTKLVRVLAGSILDVVVDARVGSPQYGLAASLELSSENGVQLLVPRGFLHGFATRQENTVVAYKVDAHYDKDADGNVLWNDSQLGINWGVDTPELSQKDTSAPRFADWTSPFKFEANR